MCELFGISSKESCQINDYLKEFYTHSDGHPHGWGLACMEGSEASIEKEPVKATRSKYLKERLSVPVEVTTAFAHIRYATIGNVEYRNCHPHTRKDKFGRRWTQNHNGTIFSYPPLNPYANVQIGDTDSERVLLYTLDRLGQEADRLGRELTPEERFHLLDSIFADMAKGNKLNLMLYDGDLFYVHTNFKGSLYKLEKEDQAVFSTQPLSNENWQPMDFTTLVAYRQGREVFRGRNHGNEYIEREEDLKFLYGIFAEL